MSLTKNRLFPLLLTLAALAIAAWALVYLTSSTVAIADEGDDTASEESDDTLNVAPKPRPRPNPVKKDPPPQSNPTPAPSDSGPGPSGSPPSQPGGSANTNSGPRTPSNFNSQPRAQPRQYTETIQQRNDRLTTQTQSCVDAAKAAGIWNNAWNDNPVMLMFIANSGVIPVSGTPKAGLATSNLQVWLHQIRDDEYQWMDRQQGQHGAWSPHFTVYSDRLAGC